MWRSWHYSSFGRGISTFRTKYNMFASIWYLLLIADRQLLPKSPQRLEYWNTQSICVWSGKKGEKNCSFFWMLASCTGNHQPGLISVTIGALVCPKPRCADRSIVHWPVTADRLISLLTVDSNSKVAPLQDFLWHRQTQWLLSNILFDVGFHFQLFKFV